MEKLQSIIGFLEEDLQTKQKSLEEYINSTKIEFENKMESYTFERNMISDLVVQTQLKTGIKVLSETITKIKLMAGI